MYSWIQQPQRCDEGLFTSLIATFDFLQCLFLHDDDFRVKEEEKKHVI